MQQAPQRLVDLGAGPQGFGKVGRPERGEHELLELEVVLGVGAAVDDVEMGDRQPQQALVGGKPAVEGLAVRQRPWPGPPPSRPRP